MTEKQFELKDMMIGMFAMKAHDAHHIMVEMMEMMASADAPPSLQEHAMKITQMWAEFTLALHNALMQVMVDEVDPEEVGKWMN